MVSVLQDSAEELQVPLRQYKKHNVHWSRTYILLTLLIKLMLTKKMQADTSRRRGEITVTRSAMGEQNKMDVDIMQNFGENTLFDSTMRKVKKLV